MQPIFTLVRPVFTWVLSIYIYSLTSFDQHLRLQTPEPHIAQQSQLIFLIIIPIILYISPFMNMTNSDNNVVSLSCITCCVAGVKNGYLATGSISDDLGQTSWERLVSFLPNVNEISAIFMFCFAVHTLPVLTHATSFQLTPSLSAKRTGTPDRSLCGHGGHARPRRARTQPVTPLSGRALVV